METKKRRQIRSVIPFLLVAIIFSSLTVTAYYYYHIYDIKELAIDFAVGDHVGVNNDVDAVHLGTSLPGGLLERKVTVESTKNARMHVDVLNVDYVTVTPEDFFIDKDTTTTITVLAHIPIDAPHATHEGILKITSRRI